MNMRKKVLISNFIIGLFLALVAILLAADRPQVLGQKTDWMIELALSLVTISFKTLTLASRGMVALINDMIFISFINGVLCAVLGYVVILICEKTKLKERIKLVWFIPASIVLLSGDTHLSM